MHVRQVCFQLLSGPSMLPIDCILLLPDSNVFAMVAKTNSRLGDYRRSNHYVRCNEQLSRHEVAKFANMRLSSPRICFRCTFTAMIIRSQ